MIVQGDLFIFNIRIFLCSKSVISVEKDDLAIFSGRASDISAQEELRRPLDMVLPGWWSSEGNRKKISISGEGKLWIYFTYFKNYKLPYEYHQSWNSSRKLEVLTIEKCWSRLFDLSLSSAIPSAILTHSSSSSGMIELEPSCRQAYGLMSMITDLEIKSLNGDWCSLST